MPTAGITPSMTSKITMELNLDSRVGTTLPAAGPNVDLADPKTYNNATSMSVYDAKGQEVALTYYFQKAATDQWNVYVTANGTSVSSNAAGVPQPVTTIQFPSNGGSPTAPLGAFSLDIPASTNAAGAQTLPITGIQLNVAGATSEVITSFVPSANLTGCAQSAGNIITCNFVAGAQGEVATITATVVVPDGSVGQAWQGDASSGNMGLGTDILEIVAPPPTTSTTTTTAPTTTTTTPVETTTPAASATTTTAAAAQTATTRPTTALPATGSSSPELLVAAAVLVLAGGGIVVGVRRRRAD
jgi:LPXTG-motif cell wall-anchored protein